MSLNQIVADRYKIWLDPYINSIRIRGVLQYKQASKVPNDNLVLDSDLVAQWVPVNSGTTPYGNAISVRMQGTLTTLSTSPVFRYSSAFSSIFSFTDQNTIIGINEVGTYLAFVNMASSNNLDSPISVKIQLTGATPSFSDVVGSEVRSFAGTTIYNTTFPFVQETNICSVAVLRVLFPLSLVRLIATGSVSGSTINLTHSSLTIVRVL